MRDFGGIFLNKNFFGGTSVVLPSAKPLPLVAPPFLAVRYKKVPPNPFKTFNGNAQARSLVEKNKKNFEKIFFVKVFVKLFSKSLQGFGDRVPENIFYSSSNSIPNSS